MQYDSKLTKKERVCIAKNIRGLKFSESYFDYQEGCERDVVYSLDNITEKSIGTSYQPPFTDDDCVMFDVTCEVVGDDKQFRRISVFAEPDLFDRMKKKEVYVTINGYEFYECDIGNKVLNDV